MGAIILSILSLLCGLIFGQIIQILNGKNAAALFIYVIFIVLYLVSLRARALSKVARSAIEEFGSGADYDEISRRVANLGGKWVRLAKIYVIWQKMLIAVGFLLLGAVISQLIGRVV